MNNAFDQLKNCADISELRPALYSLCSTFGPVARLDILAASQGGKRQALCFLRMQSAEQEMQLMQALGVGRFGGDLVVIVDLHSTQAPSLALSPAPWQPEFTQVQQPGLVMASAVGLSAAQR